MSWRDRAWPDASLTYPIDYHPSARHGARGVSTALRALYHVADYHGSFLGVIGQSYEISAGGSAGQSLTYGVPQQYVASGSSYATIGTLVARVPFGIKKLFCSYVYNVNSRYDVDPVGAFTTITRLYVAGSVTGTATGSDVTGEATQSEYDPLTVSPRLRDMFNYHYQRGGSLITDARFGFTAGRVEVDVSEVDFGASAGLIVSLQARAYDETPNNLYMSPWVCPVSCAIAERTE